eukprot:GHUV01038825.1.p1 GENE.GHUV01038825.1~~GHUV01038825.1.p1  ORF type:complete len:120 (+),score=31.91 GHUV01038825.1:358-717(+)
MENEWKAEQVLKQLEDIGAKVFFEKQLTSSDVSASGRVVVPKAIAEQYFPRIDNPSGTELGVEDAAGDTYTLRFRWVVGLVPFVSMRQRGGWCNCWSLWQLYRSSLLRVDSWIVTAAVV